MQAFVEDTRDGVDPHLEWKQVGQTYAPLPGVSDGNRVAWSRTGIPIPQTAKSRRLVVEEVEVHRVGSLYEPITGPQGRRVVFTDIIEL